MCCSQRPGRNETLADGAVLAPCSGAKAVGAVVWAAEGPTAAHRTPARTCLSAQMLILDAAPREVKPIQNIRSHRVTATVEGETKGRTDCLARGAAVSLAVVVVEKEAEGDREQPPRIVYFGAQHHPQAAAPSDFS